MRPWLRCCCCCGGAGSSCPWSEPWTDESEVQAAWTGTFTLDTGRVFAASLTRPLGGAHTVTTTMGATGAAGLGTITASGPDAAISVTHDGGVWTVAVGGGADIVLTPTDPTDPQNVVITWNDAGDWLVLVGDAEAAGTEAGVGTIAQVAVDVTDDNYVGALSATCEQYNPVLFDFWLTEDGEPWLTEDSEPWEMEDA